MTTFNREVSGKKYQFNCESKDSPTGFKHVCTVCVNETQVLKTEVKYYNRTWETYQFATVLAQASRKLGLEIEW